MSEIVSADAIEQIVGARRHATSHLARAVSKEQTVYVLHSYDCLHTTPDLRECEFSLALDVGIHGREWLGFEDAPVAVTISDFDGSLLPVAWQP